MLIQLGKGRSSGFRPLRRAAVVMIALMVHAAGIAQFASGGMTATTSGGTTASGTGAIAIGGGTGADATASKAGAIALGEAAISTQENDLSIGKHATSDGLLYENGCIPNSTTPLIGAGAFSLGLIAKSTGYGAMALGTSSSANGNNSVAIGGAKVGGAGTECSNQSIAIGADAQAGLPLVGTALRGNSIAIGTYSKSVFDGVALGGLSYAYGDHSIAIGVNSATGQPLAPVNGAGAIAIGSSAKAKDEGAMAAGSDSEATGLRSVALGKSAKAIESQSVAIGALASAAATNAVAIGASATTGSSKQHAVVIGAAATTAGGQPYDVALGYSSATAPMIATAGITIGTAPPYSFAGSTPFAAVSIGNVEAGQFRTLINVAAGRIGSNSTDAINGSQLQAVIMALESLAAEFNAYKAAHP